MRRTRAQRHLRKGPAWHLAAVAMAGLVATVLYGVALRLAYDNYTAAYRSANAMTVTLRELRDSALARGAAFQAKPMRDGVAAGRGDASDAEREDAVLMRYIRALDIRNAEAGRSAAEIRNDAGAPLRLLLDRVAAVRSQCNCHIFSLEDFNSLDALAALAFVLQQQPEGGLVVPRGSTLPDHVSTLGDRLAMIMSREPAGIFTAAQVPLRFTADDVHVPFGWPLTLTMLPRRPPTDDEVIKALVFDQFAHRQAPARIDGLVGLPFPGTRDQRVSIAPEQARVFLSFFSHTLAQLHSSPEMRAARTWVVLIQGLEQWLLLWVGLYLVVVLVGRRRELLEQERQLVELYPLIQREVLRDIGELHPDSSSRLRGSLVERTLPAAPVAVRRPLPDLIGKARRALEEAKLVPRGLDTDELRRRSMAFFVLTAAGALRERGDATSSPRDLRDVCERESLGLSLSRTVLTWGGRSLVGIGFLGTVRGIMNALSGADVIVLAGDRIQQAAAIGEVASTLGLAFATTLVALAINLVLSLALSLQAAEEVRLVARVERRCIPLVQPGLSDPSDSPEDAAPSEPAVPGRVDA